jgi:hypothetical protein
MTAKEGFVESEILELHLEIDPTADSKAWLQIQGEMAQRPELQNEIKPAGIVDFLDTPYSQRTPSYQYTPHRE